MEFKIIRDKFLKFSDHLDKQQLERSALTASQLKRSIDQSRDSLKIVKKRQRSRDVSPLFKQKNRTIQEKNRARKLKALLKANAKWNAERRKLAGQDLQQLVDNTSTIDPDLRKELLYSLERGFVEDKPKSSEWNTQILLRRDVNRRSGAALTNPLKVKVPAETPKTITTASGSVYRKRDLAKATVPVKNTPNEENSQKEKAKIPLEEQKSKHQKKDVEPEEETESE